MATHSTILVWKIPWTEEPGGLQSMGLQRVGHNLVTKLPPCYSFSNLCERPVFFFFFFQIQHISIPVLLLNVRKIIYKKEKETSKDKQIQSLIFIIIFNRISWSSCYKHL